MKDAYPIPRIDESLSKLGDAKFFTTLDLSSIFWQVALRKKGQRKDRICMRIGVVLVDEAALWLVQRHGDFSQTDDSGFDQSNEKERES